jgi:hypothetical protein
MFSKYSGGYIPKYGDFLRPHYNGIMYEIIDVIDTEEQFLNTQHTWKITVRTWVNNMLTTSQNVSAEHMLTYDDVDTAPISAYLDEDGSDFLKQNVLINDEVDEILYEPPHTSKPNDPFAGW